MILQNGSTNVSTYFVLRDSTNHAPKTDVTVTDIDLYYVESGAAISAKTDCTALDAADSLHADGGAFHVGKGIYRIDWPDAAFDGGAAKQVILIAECTGVDTTFLEVELSPPIDADGTFDRASSLTLSFEQLITRTYQILNDKMNVTDATGAVALRAIGDGSTVATGSVTDNLTTTVRGELTWA